MASLGIARRGVARALSIGGNKLVGLVSASSRRQRKRLGISIKLGARRGGVGIATSKMWRSAAA